MFGSGVHIPPCCEYLKAICIDRQNNVGLYISRNGWAYIRSAPRSWPRDLGFKLSESLSSKISKLLDIIFILNPGW